MKRVLVGAIVCATLAGAAHLARSETIAWEPYTYKTRTGTSITDGERGRLRVPESHRKPDGPKIELDFIRFRSTSKAPGPPIVWLAGGPGDFGSDDIEGPYLELVRAFQTVADVIALDQRGAGLSVPCLTCPPDEIQLPLDRPLELRGFQEAYRTVSRRCAEFWKAKGVDLSAYNTNESADDLESLRLALGVPKITLYGGSYGTHLALAAIRRHPEHIDRAILAGVEGPDQTWKLPSMIESHFAELSRLEGENASAHDLLLLMRRVLARLDREPVTVRVPSENGDSTEIVIGGLDARMANQYFLGDLDNIRNVYAIYTAMDRGDFSLLGRLALRLRTVGVGTAMYYCMDCASGATPGRLAQIRQEAALPLSLVGPALNAPFPEVCEAWPHRDLGDGFRGPLQSDVPVLFVSGSLDGHTPIQNVSELFPGFTRASHLIVVNATHQYLDLAHPDVRRIMVDFLSGRPPHPLVVTAPAVRFVSE